MHLINVDFPQPEGPRIHKKSSSFIVKSRLFKITLSELSYFLPDYLSLKLHCSSCHSPLSNVLFSIWKKIPHPKTIQKFQ